MESRAAKIARELSGSVSGDVFVVSATVRDVTRRVAPQAKDRFNVASGFYQLLLSLETNGVVSCRDASTVQDRVGIYAI